jgi:hypothetical protein
MAIVEENAVAAEHAAVLDLDPLILMALAGRTDEGVLVVKPDHTIPFYNPAFASVLDLPFPPESVTLADLHGRGLARRADGSPVPLDEQPILRAMAERRAITGCVYLRVNGSGLRPYTMSSVPFFDSNGELIGVANYVTEAEEPGRMLAEGDPLLASRHAHLDQGPA